ncbi:M20/M25/M40 family metallo-hydrolase [Dactylosporangium sp. NPDC005555]|uniref:M20 metallopeptidase family protein n=1 Tax=Dactylosporangium sp. NPDC005555 TaxID=3154889 RepID=UPI0033A1A696
MTGIWNHECVDAAAAPLDAGLVELRRAIHLRPEVAGAERHTAALVADRLRAAGLEVRTGVGGHGVVGVVRGDLSGGRTIAYRADLDALAVEGGAAHICGHDLHTAIGVGVAEVLAGLRDRFAGRVVLLFQPAEETLEGARAMLDDGALDDCPPDEVYAVHCAPLPVGVLAAMPGTGHPGLDTCHFELRGPDAASRGRRLLDRVDAMTTVRRPATDAEFAELAAVLQTPDGPLASYVVTGSHLRADSDPVTAEVWLRAWPETRHPELRDELRRLAAEADAGITFPGPPFPAMICAPELTETAAGHLREDPAVEAVLTLHAAWPFSGEDFALFLHRVPGSMFFLGVGDRGTPHALDFTPDERAVGVGVRAMTGLLLHRLAGGG